MSEETEEKTTEDAILDGMIDDDEGEENVESNEAEDAQEASSASTKSDDTTGGTADAGENKSTPRGQDLLDRDGNVVAKSGAERRFYETAQKEKSRAEALQRQLDEATAKLSGVEQAGSVGSQLGLSPDEVIAGARIIDAFKKDPSATINYLLTQAQAMGHNVEGVGSGTDLKAIQQMLDTQLKPLRERFAQEEATASRDAETERVYTQFVTKYPDAELHGDSIARLLEKDESLSPEAAYFMLRNFYLERNLDWSKPLAKLEEESKAQGDQTSQTQQSLPSGRNAAGSVVQTSEIASADASYDDIIRASMKQAGLTP